MRPPHRAVTFDLWHTLVYLRPPEEEAYMRRQVEIAVDALEASPLEPGAPSRDPASLRRAFEREYAGAVAASERGRSVTPAEQFRRAAKATGRRPRVRAYLDELERTVHGVRFRVAPGARSVLRTLRGEGYRLGVISNTVGEPGRFLRPMLRRFGFDALVESYTFSDEHPWTKPAPQIFRAALRTLDARPHRAVHVGDGWSDLAGAERAGLAGVVVFTGLQQYGAQYQKLFLASAPRAFPRGRSARTLPGTLPIIRRLVPPPAR
jgi:HAD superfamily hydrolase (TIGR01509 family)